MKGFKFHAAVGSACSLLAALVVALLPLTASTRNAAWLGVALATASGAIALLLKRRAMAASGIEALAAGFKTLGKSVAMRIGVLALGLVWTGRDGQQAGLAFACGFFALYLGQQWLEISYLLSEQNRHTQLSKVQTP